MIARDLLANPRISPLNLQILNKTLNSPSLLNCSCRHRHRRRQLGILSFRSNSLFNVIQGRRARSFTVNSLSASDVPDLPVEICMTRTLDPSLTLADGMEKIKEAIGKLKADPPQCPSGVFRFQVAVPPSVKALDWLYCQPRSLAVFPQFYLSPNHINDQSVELNPEDEVCQVSGIGSSVHINTAQQECALISRYLSVDSPLIRAYGFVGINFDPESSEIRLKDGSIHLFIPQIEVDEFANISILAATLVWDDFYCSNFEEAINSLESSLDQAIDIISPIDEPRDDKWLSYFHGHFDVAQVQNIKMIYLNWHSLIKDWSGADILQMGGVSNYWQSYVRLSITIAFTSNKLAVSHRPCCSLEKYANINVLWASLIVEECVRLGVTYFCIAPGSRSSPLAIAASTHSLTTCISCFDERSLAYHAVGFARGSNRPAAVITSSGTAVSNLLPAVVEASNDFVPLLLLTADRPPELLDTGANQAINQVNHFGSFVRFFFGLPPPTDEIPARMVLTTIDSAVYSATQVPKGPVHINCSFREPLEDIPCEWTLDCLKGLDLWISKAEPFTQYINIHNLHAFGGFHGKFVEIVEIIQNSCRGLLLIGAIHTEDEIWAALVLAKHLKWPVITDILSGLRLRKVLTSVSDIEKHIFFVDHFDHALFSDAVRSQAQPDVVVQIGSRMTSKRIAQLLEACSLCSYILVENHPHRHDPSHIITHRVQSTICEFADALIKIDFPQKTGNWNSFLQVVNKMVEWEIEFQIHAENTLTEPHVAHVIMEALRNDAALFIGNSMVIRDADMYGRGNTKDTINMSRVMSNWKVPCQFLRVAGNRGASGIDGLLSTAVGFATGCKKRVLCVVGDMSFLHDTNGLAILNQRISRKPITILVINNHGGAIFSLLPVAGMTQPRILNQYFYTSHNISINNLCKAHSLKHLHVQTKEDLQNALLSAQQSQTDCIIEVESCIKSNAIFHRILTKSARQAADCAMNALARFTYPNNVFNGITSCKINRMEYSLYRIQLSAPCTSSFLKEDRKKLHREGFVLSLFLDDGSVGFGEVTPIEIHKEDLLDVEEQLRFLLHMVHGAEISYLLSLLRGSFSSWIWKTLGIPSSSVFPSVRCGMEMAILHALAAKQGCYLVDLISGYGSSLMETSQLVKRESIINKSSPKVQICALLDSDGTPKQIAHIIAQLSNAGFKTIKLKVARRTNPDEDAAVIQEIRKEVGYGINLRADANRIWTYEEAIQFGSHLKCCDLQYIEEPVRREDDIIRFCEETGLPAALDETIDNIEGDPLDKLQHFVHPKIVALVIKPSMVGGFENAMKIAKWAHQHDKMAVISSAFESSLSLSAYVQFASYIESHNKVICRMMNKELPMTVAHGLGTYRWLREDLSTRPLKICVDPNGDTVEASVEDAGMLLQDFQINHETIQRSYKEEQFRICQTMITHDGFSCSFTVQDSGPHELNNIIIFLHGYLGTREDWIPIMKALSVTARCISIDLPGHGGSRIQQHVDKGAEKELSISIELIADMLHKLITEISSKRVVLVGYSMGARIALYMALRYTKKINGAVIISGSPGLKDELGRRNRINQDDAKAHYLLSHGLQSFLEAWYAADLWFSLRNHPHFQQIVDTRARQKDITNLARILSDSSVGRQPSLWEDLKHCETPLLLVSGEKDAKFKQIAHQMHRELISTSSGGDSQVDNLTAVVEVPDCGHVVHLENPLPLINAVRKFFNRLRKRSSNANNLQVNR